MRWLARLKKTATPPDPHPTKPTKAGFVGFVGTPAGVSQKSGGDATAANDPTQAQDFDREAFEERAAIMEFEGGLSRIEAEKLALSKAHIPPDDPDRQCWPHTTAMNTAEIDSLTARIRLFTQRGLETTEAEVMANRLVIRDRDGDDRRICMECSHLRCSAGLLLCCQYQRAGWCSAELPGEMVRLLQRCNGFAEVLR